MRGFHRFLFNPFRNQKKMIRNIKLERKEDKVRRKRRKNEFINSRLFYLLKVLFKSQMW